MFKSLDVTIYNIKPARIGISWSLEKTLRDLRLYDFYVYRGPNPEAIERVAGPYNALTMREYFDMVPNLSNEYKTLYYKVEMRQRVSGKSFFSDVKTWTDDLDLRGLYVVDEHRYLFEDAIGTPCQVFNRIVEGEYCTECFDPVTKKRLTSNCTTCYGTNFVGGYYAPVASWINLNPDPKVIEVQEWGEVQGVATNFWMLNYPRVRPKDMIVELKFGQRWRVNDVTEMEKDRCPMLQIGRLVAINNDDIEHQILVDEAITKALMQKLSERKRKREF